MTTLDRRTTTHTLDVPGAVLTYDIRPADTGTSAAAALIGSPMGASGFGTLAGHFTDRTVVTYDPRGVERSTKADPASPSTPEQHADDLHRIIAALDVGPVDLFASSGGAVNALALVARHPEQVRTLVAHEPPLASILPDREGALAASRAVHDTYERADSARAWRSSSSRWATEGPFDAGLRRRSRRPIRRCSGCPTEDDGNRTDPLLGPEHDLVHALRARLRGAAGGLDPDRPRRRRGVGGPDGVAAARSRWPSGLGTTPVIFPSGHGGFLGDEYGQPGDPDAFAAKLREVLTEA